MQGEVELDCNVGMVGVEVGLQRRMYEWAGPWGGGLAVQIII